MIVRHGLPGRVHSRDGKEAASVEQLKAIYPDEGKNAELDITAKFKVR